MSHDVFLCCAPADEALARVVCAALEDRGLRCWLAARDLEPEEAQQPEAILDAIGRCRIFLLLLSPAAQQSEQVEQEVREALRARKEAVAVKVAKAAPGTALSHLLDGFRQLDASEPPISDHLDQLGKLLSSVREDLESASGLAAGACPYRLLVVDDDADLRSVLTRALRHRGVDVTTAGSGEEALLKTERAPCDVALLDLHLPGMSGIDLLTRLKARQADLEVLLLTAHGSIETAIKAMRHGAYDYLTKPFQLPELEIHLQKAYEKVQLTRRERQWLEQAEADSPRRRLVGSGPQMQKVRRLIEKVAPVHSAVLVCGESGTGKELVARALHRNSPRRERPLVIVHCAGQEALALERELFGHEEKAVNGALKVERGLVETAEGGTLFIDEVAEMAAGVQAKLLRLLEDGHYRRVGSTAESRADVRVIAATERALFEEMRSGRFREDLYYRLNVVAIGLPPLRERLGDVPELVEHLLDRCRIRSPRCQITPEALDALLRYPWPGNVRELANVLERAQILAAGTAITPDDLPDDLVKGRAAGDPLTRPSVPPPRAQVEALPSSADGLGGVLLVELRLLRTRAPGLSTDLAALETLLPIDVPSSLNKIRFLTEKLLHQLCSEHHVSWGGGEPTLGSMIGPLIVSGGLPRNVAIHVRTIQANASPGSHYQESALSESHLRIALAALIEFLRWASEDRPLPGSAPRSE
jgi:DNA-binding NtrC family response regulator